MPRRDRPPRTVIVGAGSGFGRRLTIDILSYPEFREGTLALVDISRENLEPVAAFAERVIKAHGADVELLATEDRRAALEGADTVIVSIAVGGAAYQGPLYHAEVTIPQQYGLEQSVADTSGVGGIFRTLRTAPVMLEICRDMERLCPDALLINYTNPMAMLCWVMNAATSIRSVGLCHSVQGTAHELAGYIGAPREELTYWVAGINHMAWFLELRRNGEDAYPALRACLDNPETVARDPVRFEVLRYFDYFVTESSRHMSEYLPYFRRTPELLERYGQKPSQVSAEHRSGRWEWQDPDFMAQLRGEKPVDLSPSHEYASHIMHAIACNEPLRINGNVSNDRLITNLPDGCCVEVPCLVDGLGVHPCEIGDLPPQLASLNRSNVAVHELTVQAVLEQSRRKALQAVLVDPLASSVCNFRELEAMFGELCAAEGEWVEYLR